MTDEEKQAMLDKMCAEGLHDVDTMSKERFIGLLDALGRMFRSRIWNCCDSTGYKDHEWSTLSAVCRRAIRELATDQVKEGVK